MFWPLEGCKNLDCSNECFLEGGGKKNLLLLPSSGQNTNRVARCLRRECDANGRVVFLPRKLVPLCWSCWKVCVMEIHNRLRSSLVWRKTGRTGGNAAVGSGDIALEEGCSPGAHKRGLFQPGADSCWATWVHFCFFPHRNSGITIA